MSYSALSASFEYLCYGSAAIIYFTLSVWWSTLDVRNWKGQEEKETWSHWYKMKWNESGFRPPLCTYRLNWARRTSWGWWDDWDDTVLQTQDSKFEPWRSEAEHATSRSRRLPTILTFTRGWGRNNFVSFKPPRPGTEPRTLAWKAAVLTTTLGPPPGATDICWDLNHIHFQSLEVVCRGSDTQLQVTVNLNSISIHLCLHHAL